MLQILLAMPFSISVFTYFHVFWPCCQGMYIFARIMGLFYETFLHLMSTSKYTTSDVFFFFLTVSLAAKILLDTVQIQITIEWAS
ncbi:unnamed protein product [Caenorhabditis auriculariae]|uniref:Uncharacterized protein n=1 Tax=Caenorhabditis auriculariae TaxID=2777116 RepID=A0A8S1HFA7_9PELO|nr:unnamed protein product [Caenorhabditis auriculariae]